MTERLSDRIFEYLQAAVGREVNLRDIRVFLKIEPGSKDDQNLRTQMATTMISRRVVKPSGRGDGIYKVIVPIEPIAWSLDGDDREGILDFRFPRSYIDDTTFGLEDLVEIFAGDMILLDGRTNFGKSAIAYSILGENLDLLLSILMGNELTTSKLEITPKLKRRLRRMFWAKWMGEDGKPRFDILPVGVDYEEYIRRDYLNVVDWITLPGEYWLIDSVLKAMKDRVGKGILVAVLQKGKDSEYAEGGERTQRHADLELRIDSYGENESVLTVARVKSPKGKNPVGRKWAFDITDYGANLENIREVVRCGECWGKGWKNNRPCANCHKIGYIDKKFKEEQ